MNDDTISRQAAIDALERIFDRCEEIEAHFPDGDPDKTGYKMFPDYMTVWKYLHQLPSAERHGRWIKKYRGNYLCSVCGAWYRTTDDYGNIIDGEMTANYCESCGAKMDEVEE